MNVNGQAKLFIKELKSSKGGTFKKFTSNISTKQTDGSYVNLPVDIIFNKEKYPEATLNKLDPANNYDIDIQNGFLYVREYEANGNIFKVLCIYVNDCTINNPKETKAKQSKKNSLV